MSGKQSREFFGSKSKTYHWDTEMTPGLPHSGSPHLQIHKPDGVICPDLLRRVIPIRLQVRNRLTMLKSEVTAEVASSRTDRRAWMMIRPNEDGGFMLVEFEHNADVDTDAWLSPEDILGRERTDFGSLDELLGALMDRGIDTEAFDAPWKMDYPL